jgi:hypothetical protein
MCGQPNCSKQEKGTQTTVVPAGDTAEHGPGKTAEGEPTQPSFFQKYPAWHCTVLFACTLHVFVAFYLMMDALPVHRFYAQAQLFPFCFCRPLFQMHVLNKVCAGLDIAWHKERTFDAEHNHGCSSHAPFWLL